MTKNNAPLSAVPLRFIAPLRSATPPARLLSGVGSSKRQHIKNSRHSERSSGTRAVSARFVSESIISILQVIYSTRILRIARIHADYFLSVLIFSIRAFRVKKIIFPKAVFSSAQPSPEPRAASCRRGLRLKSRRESSPRR